MKSLQKISGLVLLMFLFCFAGCDDKTIELTNDIVSTQITGNANDGDSAIPPASYAPNSPTKEAIDGETTARGLSHTYNQLSGSALAKNGNPDAATVTDDEAVANSFNKVVSVLKVHNAGAYRFKSNLSFQDLVLHGGGQLTISVTASLLDSNGAAVPNGQLLNVRYAASLDASGKMKLSIEQTAGQQNAQSIDVADSGNYTDAERYGPSANGIQIAQGDYRVEFDVRIQAKAPVEKAPDGQPAKASVDSVTVSIDVFD